MWKLKNNQIQKKKIHTEVSSQSLLKTGGQMVGGKNFRRSGKSRGASLEMTQFIDAGSNKIKKRIRDIERLLSKKRDKLPDTIIIEKERTLEALKMELENAKLKQKVKENAKKYHMVRFFERKKALRGYKKALKCSKEDENNKEAKQELREREIDLCYIVNFPKTEKYIALYPSNTADSEHSKGNENTNLKREAFREIVTKQLKENSLPVSLKDILKGKKLDKDDSGIVMEDIEGERTNVASTKNENIEEEEEEDDFFE